MTPAQCAEWLGCDEGVMQAEHDILHADLCEWLGVESQSLRAANGQKLAPEQRKLAELEEHAVLAVQRFRAHVRVAAEGIDSRN